MSLLQLGSNIRQIRERVGLSQEQLALQAGLDRTYVSGIERGKRNPSVLSLKKLSDAMGANLQDLFEGI